MGVNLEEVFGIQQPGVDLGRRLIPLADDEDLGRGVAGGGGLGGLHAVEQLLERIQQCIVVLRPASKLDRLMPSTASADRNLATCTSTQLT